MDGEMRNGESPAEHASDSGASLQTLVRDIARFGPAPALIVVGADAVDIWSFAKLTDLAHRLASGLRQAGVKRGEAVLLYGPNSPEWVVVRLALGALGTIAVPIDDLSPIDEAAAALAEIGCRRVFAASAHVATLRASAGGAALDIHVLDDAGETHAAASWRTLLADGPEDLPTLPSDAAAMLVQTSGTTGPPRSFTLSGVNIWTNVEPLVRSGLVGPTDRVLLPLPLHHVYPFVVGLLVPLAAGAAVVLPEGVSGPQLVRALRESEASTIVGVPRLYAALEAGITARFAARGRLAVVLFDILIGLSSWARRALDWRLGALLFRPLTTRFSGKLRLLVSGGAKLDVALTRRLEALGWTVRSGYGLAETASIFTGNLPGRKRIGSEGQPFQGGEVRIDGPDADGVGEILLRGPNVCAGYRDNPDANQQAFTTDGWFRSGDLGRLDAGGFLHVEGRAKELIVLGGGKNVFPEALEAIYLAGGPVIHEIAILEHGGALHGLVRPDHDAIRATGTVRVEAAIRIALAGVARTLPGHQRLAGFALVREPLPRTRFGKFRRFLLPDVYAQARCGAARPKRTEWSTEDRAVMERPLPAAVWGVLEARYPALARDLDSSPQLDLGIDSLEWITLGLELERVLGVQLEERDIAGIDSLRDLIATVDAAASRPAHDVGEEAMHTSAIDDVARWTAPEHIGQRIVGRAIALANRLVMRLLFSLKVKGIEGLLENGPFVIVANHVSDLDPPVVAAALPWRCLRRTYWSGDVGRLFATPLWRFFCRATHVFPIDEHAPAASLAMARAVLEAGHVLVWFPEAWRSPTGELQQFLPGIGVLIQQTQAPVVPAYIDGAFEAMPRWAKFPRLRPIRVRLGRPIDAATLSVGTVGTPETRIVAAVHKAVEALSRDRKA